MIKNYTNELAKQIINESLTEKKELSYTEKRALFGYLFDIYNYNYDLFSELGIESVSVLYDNCMIQNNELRFFCGEGIDLLDGKRLDSIFLNKNDCLVFSIYNEDEKEEFYI